MIRILILLGIFLIPTTTAAQKTSRPPTDFNVYFVAVGSTHYAEPDSPTARSLHRLRGANKSARLVADRLLRGGARFGVTLTSADGAFVTVGDVNAAVGHAMSVIRANRPPAPLFIFYFAGHGVTEGVGWNHFSVPGDFTFEGALAGLNPEMLSERTLHAARLIEGLDKQKIPYLVLLDTCYEGTEARFESPVLTGPATESLSRVASILRVMNEFRQEHPVLFSTAPGTVVPTVPDPTNSGPDRIGPLARRAIMIFDEAARDGKEINLSAFVRRMTASDLDTVTKPAVTAAQTAPAWSRVIFRPAAPNGKLEERQGSATGPSEPCCARATAAPPAGQRMAGKIELVGGRGEYITEGRTIVITGTGESITAALDGEGDVVVTASKDDETWELAFSMPGRVPVKSGRYTGAERHGFASAGRPGLSVTGPGRACNRVQGDFVITDVAKTADGRLSRLNVTLTQRCDDNPAVLRATIDLRGP